MRRRGKLGIPMKRKKTHEASLQQFARGMRNTIEKTFTAPPKGKKAEGESNKDFILRIKKVDKK